MRRLMMRRRGSQMATPRTGDVAHSRRRLRLPTSGAALAVSIAALIVAMAGSAYAATTLAKNSVGTKQLQKGAVTSGKIAKGAVTNGKIAKGAVGAGKLKSGLVVPNASHANTADSATKATSATTATSATSATNATNATNAVTAANGVLSLGNWTGGIGPIPVNSGFVFAGPQTTLTTTATQTIVASSEAALATAAATTTADISICKQPTTGTPTVTLLDLKVSGAFSIVTVGTTRISYPANAVGAPGAGTWKIGECVNNTGATNAIDQNDFVMGYAFVVNAVSTPGTNGPPGPVH
jgi:hypothetical protein